MVETIVRMGEKKMGVRVDENHLSSYAGVVEGDKIYTVDSIYGLFLEYSMKDYSHRILTHIDCLDVSKGQYIINKIIKVRDVFYFFLVNCHDFISWSLSDYKFHIFESHQKKDQRYHLVSNAFFWEGKIWICPAYSDQSFRCFDTVTEKMTEYASIEKRICNHGIRFEGGQFIYASIENDRLWFAIYNTPYIASYNMKKDEWRFYSLADFGKVFNICFDGNDLWICFMDQNIFLSWEPERGVKEIFQISDSELSMDKGDPFKYIYGDQNYVYAIPTYDNNIYAVHRVTKKIDSTDFLHNYNRTDIRPYVPLFHVCIRVGKQLILLPYAIDKIVVINMETGKLQYIDSLISQIDQAVYLDYVCKQKSIQESDELTLKEYISYIHFRKAGRLEQKRGVFGQVIAHEIV